MGTDDVDARSTLSKKLLAEGVLGMGVERLRFDRVSHGQAYGLIVEKEKRQIPAIVQGGEAQVSITRGEGITINTKIEKIPADNTFSKYETKYEIVTSLDGSDRKLAGRAVWTVRDGESDQALLLQEYTTDGSLRDYPIASIGVEDISRLINLYTTVFTSSEVYPTLRGIFQGEKLIVNGKEFFLKFTGEFFEIAEKPFIKDGKTTVDAEKLGIRWSMVKGETAELVASQAGSEREGQTKKLSIEVEMTDTGDRAVLDVLGDINDDTRRLYQTSIESSGGSTKYWFSNISRQLPVVAFGNERINIGQLVEVGSSTNKETRDRAQKAYRALDEMLEVVAQMKSRASFSRVGEVGIAPNVYAIAEAGINPDVFLATYPVVSDHLNSVISELRYWRNSLGEILKPIEQVDREKLERMFGQGKVARESIGPDSLPWYYDPNDSRELYVYCVDGVIDQGGGHYSPREKDRIYIVTFSGISGLVGDMATYSKGSLTADNLDGRSLSEFSDRTVKLLLLPRLMLDIVGSDAKRLKEIIKGNTRNHELFHAYDTHDLLAQKNQAGVLSAEVAATLASFSESEDLKVAMIDVLLGNNFESHMLNLDNVASDQAIDKKEGYFNFASMGQFIAVDLTCEMLTGKRFFHGLSEYTDEEFSWFKDRIIEIYRSDTELAIKVQGEIKSKLVEYQSTQNASAWLDSIGDYSRLVGIYEETQAAHPNENQ